MSLSKTVAARIEAGDAQFQVMAKILLFGGIACAASYSAYTDSYLAIVAAFATALLVSTILIIGLAAVRA